MRLILLLLLLPAIVFSQTTEAFPDTIVLKTGFVTNCFLVELGEDNIRCLTQNNDYRVNFSLIEKLIISQMGDVYNKDGYLIDKNILNGFLQNRCNNIKIKQNNSVTNIKNKDLKPKLSFGFDYSPLHFMSRLETKDFDDYYTILKHTGNATARTNISYAITQKIRLLTNIWLYQSYEDMRLETHLDYSDENYNDTHKGYVSEINMNMFELFLGCKYFLIEPEKKGVSPYLTFAIGKRFADYKGKSEDLFVEEQNNDYESNFEEFIENVNSPIKMYIGFGSEYFFTNNFSIFSAYEYEYQKYSGKYRNSSEGENSSKGEYESELIYNIKEYYTLNRISLGINYYF